RLFLDVVSVERRAAIGKQLVQVRANGEAVPVALPAEVVTSILKRLERSLDVANVEVGLPDCEPKLRHGRLLPLLSPTRFEEERRRHLLMKASAPQRFCCIFIEPSCM